MYMHDTLDCISGVICCKIVYYGIENCSTSVVAENGRLIEHWALCKSQLNMANINVASHCLAVTLPDPFSSHTVASTFCCETVKLYDR